MPLFRKRTRTLKGTREGVDETTLQRNYDKNREKINYLSDNMGLSEIEWASCE